MSTQEASRSRSREALSGEDADVVGASLDLLVQPFQRDWCSRSRPVGGRGVGEGGELLAGVAQQQGHGRELAFQGSGHVVDRVAAGVGGGLGEDDANRGGDHLRLPLRRAGEHVAQEVHLKPCQAAPVSTVWIAAVSPRWESSAATRVAITTAREATPAIDPGLAADGVEKHVAERLLDKRAGASGSDLAVELGAD